MASSFEVRGSCPLSVTEDFHPALLQDIKLLAADLDKTLYPNGMGNATTPPSAEAKSHFGKNLQCYMDFMETGRYLAIPVTGNSPALAQAKFDRSNVTFNVLKNPGVFCNGALVLGVNGVVEYEAPISESLIKAIQKFAMDGDGFLVVDGRKYPFAINCMTKSQVLYFEPSEPNKQSLAIAEGWATMQLMKNDLAQYDWTEPDSAIWKNDPAYQINLLLKSRSDMCKDDPAMEDPALLGKVQAALFEKLQKVTGQVADYGYQGKHVLQPWCETNIVKQGVNKGQSLNRFIHAPSVKGVLGFVDVGKNVMVAGDAQNDLPMFLEWGQVDDFNSAKLAKTAKPAIRMIMPDSEDEKLRVESNVRNKCYEVLEAVLKSRGEESQAGIEVKKDVSQEEVLVRRCGMSHTLQDCVSRIAGLSEEDIKQNGIEQFRILKECVNSLEEDARNAMLCRIHDDDKLRVLQFLCILAKAKKCLVKQIGSVLRAFMMERTWHDILHCNDELLKWPQGMNLAPPKELPPCVSEESKATFSSYITTSVAEQPQGMKAILPEELPPCVDDDGMAQFSAYIAKCKIDQNVVATDDIVVNQPQSIVETDPHATFNDDTVGNKAPSNAEADQNTIVNEDIVMNQAPCNPEADLEASVSGKIPLRHDFGLGIGYCALCRNLCLNRGCKVSNRSICHRCWPSLHA
jgi:hydroxymethylpyrimidine pyrophosphatase-like HAD family hydrolase